MCVCVCVCACAFTKLLQYNKGCFYCVCVCARARVCVCDIDDTTGIELTFNYSCQGQTKDLIGLSMLVLYRPNSIIIAVVYKYYAESAAPCNTFIQQHMIKPRCDSEHNLYLYR